MTHRVHYRVAAAPSRGNHAADSQSPTQQQTERTFKPCGCEGTQDLGRMRPTAASPADAFIQTKSAASADDVHEREADRIAEAMVRASPPKSHCSTCGGRHDAPEIQRKALGPGAAPTTPAHGGLQHGGQPLAAPTRALFEPRFGYDFGQVRVHSDARASEVARSYNALALTAGTHIWFGAGQLDMSSQAGRQLIAHELAHVVQQSLFAGSIDERTVEPTNSAAEREASAAADDVAAGREANKISAVPRGITRDVGWASRGEIPDPWGIGFNTIYKNAGPESKQAVLALSALTTASMFVDIEAYKKLPLPMRKAVLALEPHAAGTGCAGWFDVMRANDPDLKPKYTAEEIAAGEAAYHSANREVAVAHKVEEAKQAAPALTGMDVEKQWGTNKYGLITSAQTPNHGIKADALHAIWIKYWADKIKVSEGTIDAMDQTQIHDPNHPDPSDDPGYRQAKAVNELGRYLLADTVGAIEICRFADSVGKSLTLDELDKQVIEHSKFMERMQLLLMVLTSIGPRGAPKGGKKPPQPGKGISVKTEPLKTEPIKTEPVKTEPVKTEPVKTEPGKTEPVKTEPVKTEPVKTEPVKTEPVKTEPVKTEPVKTEPVKTEPVTTEPVKTEPVKTEPVSANAKPPFPKNDFPDSDPGWKQWPPPKPTGAKPEWNQPGGARYRYDRYRYTKWEAEGKPAQPPKDLMSPQEYYDRYTAPKAVGQSTGEPGGPAHRALVDEVRDVNGIGTQTMGAKRPDAVGKIDQPLKIPSGPTVKPEPGGRVLYEADNFFKDGSQIESKGREQVRQFRQDNPKATIVVQDTANAKNIIIYEPGTQPPPRGNLPPNTPNKVPFP